MRLGSHGPAAEAKKSTAGRWMRFSRSTGVPGRTPAQWSKYWESETEGVGLEPTYACVRRFSGQILGVPSLCQIICPIKYPKA